MAVRGPGYARIWPGEKLGRVPCSRNWESSGTCRTYSCGALIFRRPRSHDKTGRGPYADVRPFEANEWLPRFWSLIFSPKNVCPTEVATQMGILSPFYLVASVVSPEPGSVLQILRWVTPLFL